MTFADLAPAPVFTNPDAVTIVEIWNAAETTRLVDSVPVIVGSMTLDDPLSEAGLLNVSVGLDEDAMEFLVAGNKLRVVIDGRDAFTALIEPEITLQRVHVDGPVSHVAKLACRGRVVELDDCTIDAYGGTIAKPQALTRPMSWCSPEADLSALDPVAVLFSALSVPWAMPQTDPPWFSPWLPPRGMADQTASWVWASLPDPDDGHPPQTRRIVKDITIAHSGLYLFQVAADDGFVALGNGDKLGEGATDPGDTFVVPWQGCWNLTAGTLRVGIEGYNYDKVTSAPVGTFGGPNIGRLAFALYYLPDGVGTVLSDAVLVAHTDSSWLTLDTDDPLPAPTWDVIVGTFLTEAQTASEAGAAGWSVTSATLAQQGDQAFGIADDTTVLSVLRQGSTSGCIDWRQHQTDRQILLDDFGAMGSDHAATYTEADGTLIDLQERTIGGFCNSLDVRHKTGREIVEDATSIGAHGRRRKALPLADLDRDAAVAQAQRELAIRSQPRSSFTAAIECDVGTANAPYGDGGPLPGDSPTFGVDRMRIVRISTTFDEAGRPTFVFELQTRLQGEAERQQIALSKAGASLQGTSRAATALEGVPTKTVAGLIRDADDLVFTQVQLTPTGMESIYDVSPPRKWKHAARVHRVEITQVVPPQDVDTIVDIIQSGPGGSSTLVSVTLPVGFYHAVELVWYGNVGEFDNLHAEWSQHDTAIDDPDDPLSDARWCTVTVHAVDARPAVVEPAAVDVPW